LPEETDFTGGSIDTVKKMREVWQKTNLFGPDNVPPNQLTVKRDCTAMYTSMKFHDYRFPVSEKTPYVPVESVEGFYLQII
jgi:hypothetical protein